MDTPNARAIPWHLWCLAAAGASTMFGVYWDISWHMSIGRDTFWTPAHMAIYLGGVLAGIACGYAVLTATFGSSPELRAASVRVLGFRGPLGCFLAAWGAIAMLTSAPFDNWWHDAYGLDVKIISFPHSILAIGIGAINTGALVLACSAVNRASGTRRLALDRLMLWVAAIELSEIAIFLLENTSAASMHNAIFYTSACSLIPLILVAVSRVSESRWPATTVAGIYTVLWLLGLWIFPLFPAEPKLGPVYQNITHFVPLRFPMLIIVPAFALDLLRKRSRSALLAGVVYFAVLLTVQWPFGIFLMSPLARNRIFGRIYFPYADPANITYDPYQFWHNDASTVQRTVGFATALIVAIVSASIGVIFGNWLRRVKR